MAVLIAPRHQRCRGADSHLRANAAMIFSGFWSTTSGPAEVAAFLAGSVVGVFPWLAIGVYLVA
jgi:hypothetical protein